MEETGYIKYVDRIGKQEFIGLFTDIERLEDWFSAGELKVFSFPKNAGSLAARYLVKKRILDELSLKAYGKEIGIMNDEFGKPVIKLNDNTRKEMDKAGIKEIFCSLSHSRNYIAVMTIFT